MRLWRWSVLSLLAAAAAAFGGRLSFQERAAVQESLARVHPRMRASWLEEHGVEDPYYMAVRRPDSGQGLREVGRWSYGPSYDVDGRTTPGETLVALARGSGVSLLRFSRQDSLSIELLSDINAEGLMCRVKVVGTLLYVGSRKGLEVYNIADEQVPIRLSWIPLPLNDFDVQDSLAYTISGGYTDNGGDDSFRIYNVSNPASPVFRGACRDSGDLVSVAGHAAFLGDRWGLYVLDVTNPTSPHRIGSWGSAIEQVQARGRLCYVTTFNPNVPGEITFHVLDVAVPSLPYQIGSLDSVGGYGVYLMDTLAFCSGDADLIRFTIVSVADSTRPYALSATDEGGWGMGMWASGLTQAAFGAFHWGGLDVFDTRNTSNPVRDTFLLDADEAVDVYVDNGRAYVANQMSGLKILDVQDPARPTTLGAYDSAGQFPHMSSVVARDSFAFADWFWFRVVDVSDPAHPKAAGQLDPFNPQEDMIIRDSFVYCAEMNRFQVVNVARPRQPVLVGSCVIQGTGVDLLLKDTLAYVSSLPTQIVSVRNPANPVVIGTIPTYGHGIEIRDSFAFVPALYDSMVIYNISDPATPVRVARHTFSGGHVWNSGIALVDTLLYVGGDIVHVVDVADPLNSVEVGTWILPGATRRLSYAAPCLYAACYEAGVCILESVPPGLEESPEKGGITKEIRLSPSVTTGRIAVEAWAGADRLSVCLYDASGAKVKELQASTARSGTRLRFEIDLSGFPDGIYFVSLKGNDRSFTTKVVKTKGR
jgi:hypothetical protein